MERAYFLGLDIGTDSVGYAVTDKEYNLIKFHGEPAWGIHLFDEAGLSADRRAFRVARRRLDRRQQRVGLLQELFAEAVGKVDPRFFVRQKESGLYPEDKSDKSDANSLFNDEGYTDKEYHAEFPTIHHLIVALMKGGKAYDVRLVYLACAWLVAHRGHFLNGIDKHHVDRITDFGGVYADFMAHFTDRGYCAPWASCDMDAFGDCIKRKTSLTAKYKRLAAVCFPGQKVPKQPADPEVFPYNCEVLLKCLCGSKIKAKDLFDNEEYEEIPSFSLGSDDETLAQVMGALDDDAELIERMKAVYDWGLLVDILGGKATISEAKVAVYQQHEQELILLKYFIHKYLPEKYAEVFRESRKELKNYTAYSYHGDTAELEKGKASQEEFCAYLRGLFKNVVPDGLDAASFANMKERLELNTFLPKQKNTDNRVIPYQLYWHELDEILKNAEGYLPFLAEKDADGLSVSDKVRSTFEFPVPYFVGPLNPGSEHAWVCRKAGRIVPWNFDGMVDLDASEDAFIDRMVNRCSYLPGESVLPRESLLYHRFTVLNEINNLRINDVPITVEQKQSIYTELFMKYRKVTFRKIAEHLCRNGWMKKEDVLSGVDTAIHSDLKSYHDFKDLLDSGRLTEEEAEEIIRRRTYSEDKNRYARWLAKHYPRLTEKEFSRISRLTYKDFGRLSARLLTGIEAVTDPATGEAHNIIGAMWATNRNLMELLSGDLGYMAQIEAEREAYYSAHPTTLEERLDEMYISNAVKRPILRSIAITREVIKAFGHAPEKIFVEMARSSNPDQKGKRTLSRREQILALYEKCRDEDVPHLLQQLNAMGDEADSRLQSKKLFLYYTQLGRCAYTGKPIDLESLMHSDTGKYNIEHIYPQSLVKDDSIINNEVLVDSIANGVKSDTYPVDAAIRAKMLPFWTKWKDAGLISEEKFKRLTRSTGFTEDEKWGFINRQLTETTQATKAVAELLKDICPDTEVVYVKAQLASTFRQEFDCLKSRSYNDLHHAKDAYLNIVVGNVYHMRFTRRWFHMDEHYNVQVKKIFTNPVICGGETVWTGAAMKDKVVKTVKKNNVHMTRYAFTRGGGFFDQMPRKKAEGLIPRKDGLATEKYGGYNKPSVCFFMLVKYRIGKKTDIMVTPIELMHKGEVLGDAAAAEAYVKRRIGVITGKTVSEVSFPMGQKLIKINTILSLDGYRIFITGTGNGGTLLLLATFMPFIGQTGTEAYIKKLEVLANKLSENPDYICDAWDKVTAEENLALYDLMLDKLKTSIYRKRPNNPAAIIEKGRNAFVTLEVKEQAKVLLTMLSVFGRMSGGCDLKAIGGSAHTGATTISTNISNWRKNYTDVRIIDQSASGLWEKQSENLLYLK